MKQTCSHPDSSDKQLVWECGVQRIVVSPADGGRVTSWRHGEHGELVKQQQGLDGGLVRVLVSPERYPGSSYVTPHQVIESHSDADGFRIHLRYAWNTANAIAGILGWTDKAGPAYLDGLLLDKVLTFDRARCVLMVELRFSNLNAEVRWVNPWLHNHFHGWVDRSFVVMDGAPGPYLCLEQFWAGHRAPTDKTMRLVQTGADGRLWSVLGAETGWLDGMASYTRANFGPGSTDGGMELRGKSVRLEPGHAFVCNAFIALGTEPEGWRHWAKESPVPLFHHVENRAPAWRPRDLIPLLDHWALPGEADAGVMILSHLDKLPFAAARRYSAARQFSNFRKHEGQSEASVWIYALRALAGLSAAGDLPAGWALNGLPVALAQGVLVKLALRGPVDLAGREEVQVRLAEGNQEIARITVVPDAALVRARAGHIRQTSAYLDRRFHDEQACFSGGTVEALKVWQEQRRRLFRERARNAVTGSVPLKARLTERQEGPTCIREKVVIQTEPGMWIPLYVVRPRRLMGVGRLPAVLFLCGSGPGKMDMVPDETGEAQRPEHDEAWPSPYAIANRMGCVLACPDRRGWGELAEGNHSQQPGRARAGGFDIGAAGVWDHLRVVDYLCSRPDVDTRYLLAMGSSGGGNTTRELLGGHERIAGGIVSSAAPMAAVVPEHFFFRPEPPEMPSLRADAALVQTGAPRPVWIMDGRWDRCTLPALPVTDSERQAIFEKWHRDCEAGREAIRTVYRLLGAEERFRATWFDGDHLAGFNYRNIREWVLHYWPEAFEHKLGI
jgi:hypothetical protein